MRRVFGLSDSLRSRHSSSSRNDSASESDSRSAARPAVSSARSARISSKSSPPTSASPALAITRVGVVFHLDQRRVEGAAAEVVDQQRTARLSLALGLLAMAELDARRRRLVEHAQHMEAGRAKGFAGQKSLVAVGVGRHADHDFERLAAIERQRGSLPQLLAERRQQLRRQLHQRYRRCRRDPAASWGPRVSAAA